MWKGIIMDLVQVKSFLYKEKKSFETALNCSEAYANKYLQGVYNTIINNEKLQKCDLESIKNAAVTSATLGVPVDANNFAYLIPYNGKVQLQLSYKGYVYMAKQDSDVDNISAVLVYPEDEFSVDLGNNIITHIPKLDSESYGREHSIKFVYAIVRFKKDSGRSQMFEVMTKKQVDEIRASSKAGGQKDKHGKPTIWEKHYGEMARKTAIKRLCKHAQLGNIAQADQIDNAFEQNKIINVTPDNELLVESPDSEKVKEIIEDVNNCHDLESFQGIQAKYQDTIQELMLYNVTCSKEVTKAMGVKEDELYIDKVTSALENCEDDEGIDKVWQAHEKRINQLKAKDRNSVTEIYTDMKQFFIDENVA